MSPNRKVEQGEVTRRALVAAAVDLFTEKGFAATSTEDIAQRANVTKGALYHHFDGKEDLFRAALESVEAAMVSRIHDAGMRTADPLEKMRRGFRAYLDVCTEPAMQRIVLLEGPSVLGWSAWHEIDEAYGYGLVAGALEAAMRAGAIEEQDVGPLAHLLLGALTQAGLVVARSGEPRKRRTAMVRSLDRLLDGLRP